MNRNSFWKNIFIVVGFIVVASFLINVVGGLLAFALRILIPVAIVIFLIRFIRGDYRQRPYR